MRILILTPFAVLALVVFWLVIPFDLPPIEAVQRGYRGTGMEQVYDPDDVEVRLAVNQVPAPEEPIEPAGVPSSEVYENVQVLGDVDSNEFLRLMQAITNWVSPEQGCAYCHNEENLADDGLYTKIVSRRMLQMTRHINSQWKNHVQTTGVTCYTCHRGRPVPQNIWFADPGPARATGLVTTATGQNHPAPSVGMASLPSDIYSPFLAAPSQGDNIRVGSTTALPDGNRTSTKQAEWTYGLMMHMSNGLGVNCTYCHNSRAFGNWSQSSPARTSAWYGIRMVRDLNVDYLEPLGPEYPHARIGPLGDAPKVNCTTCHEGVFKPLYGAGMVKDYPELYGVGGRQAQSASIEPTAIQPASAE